MFTPAPYMLQHDWQTSVNIVSFGSVHCTQLLTWQLPWAGKQSWHIYTSVMGGERPAVPDHAQLPGPDTQQV